MEKTKQELPKWFTGQLYNEGDTVRNPYSGESYELTAEELSMYDFIMGANQLMAMGMIALKSQKDMRKGLDWFRKNNVEAYYVLLD
tara:strand:- start:649 stop:906 length:258 start_codon:yes stop_codon:yes gene_type:complete